MSVEVVVSGCGEISRTYIETLKEFEDVVRLTAVYDSDTERATATSERWDLTQYDSMQTLLALERADIVVNLTPPLAHKEVTLTALEHGRAVYSEKPLGTTFAEAAAIHETAASRSTAGVRSGHDPGRRCPKRSRRDLAGACGGNARNQGPRDPPSTYTKGTEAHRVSRRRVGLSFGLVA